MDISDDEEDATNDKSRIKQALPSIDFLIKILQDYQKCLGICGSIFVLFGELSLDRLCWIACITSP